MYGNPADLAKLKTIAKKYNLYLIEDGKISSYWFFI